jgi:hypothetical protein
MPTNDEMSMPERMLLLYIAAGFGLVRDHVFCVVEQSLQKDKENWITTPPEAAHCCS